MIDATVSKRMTDLAQRHDRFTDAGADLLKAVKLLAHPERYRLMILLTDREACPTELAEITGYDFKRVCKHVRLLEEKGFIELVDTDHRRGGVQHFYRATTQTLISTSASEDLILEEREGISRAISTEMLVDMLRATDAGTMDSRVERVLIRAPLVFDDQAWGEADEAAVEYMEKLYEIQARSDERRDLSGEAGTNVATGTTIFPLP